jgi:hypothetical protein
MSLGVRLVSLVLLFPLSALAGIFGEGFSSSLLGGPPAIRYRAFTIYTAQEACAESALPAEFRVRPNPLRMRLGDRVHRTNVERNPSELIIEAYGEDGEFLPAVPIIVSTVDVQNVTVSRSDWDYFEAVRDGEDELVIAWACRTPNGVQLEARVSIIVASSDVPPTDRREDALLDKFRRTSCCS